MAAVRKKDNRPQINIRVDAEILEIIEELRRAESPIPSVSDAVRNALRLARDHKKPSSRR